MRTLGECPTITSGRLRTHSSIDTCQDVGGTHERRRAGAQRCTGHIFGGGTSKKALYRGADSPHPQGGRTSGGKKRDPHRAVVRGRGTQALTTMFTDQRIDESCIFVKDASKAESPNASPIFATIDTISKRWSSWNRPVSFRVVLSLEEPLLVTRSHFWNFNAFKFGSNGIEKGLRVGRRTDSEA
jgi:hypothetical protein